jgi:hypothetical protein
MNELPSWAAVLIVIGGFIGFLALIMRAVPLNNEPDIDPDFDRDHPHPSNRWSGTCYRCGRPVRAIDAVELHTHGKPPKRFCKGCRPRF